MVIVLCPRVCNILLLQFQPLLLCMWSVVDPSMDCGVMGHRHGSPEYSSAMRSVGSPAMGDR